MKTIIVTGGLGFIGSNLVRKLVEKYKVIIVDKKTYSANLDNLEGIPSSKYKIYKQDISNYKKFLLILNKYKPVGIFNLAAETHVDRSIEYAKPFINSNILGTFSILEAMRSYQKKKSNLKLIHISTDEVYGDIQKNKFSKESDSYLPSSPYAASKACSDHLVFSYYKTFDIPVIITNCSNNYGPRQFPEKLIPKIILNIIKNKNIPIYGKGKNQREWIYVDDHVDALIKVFNKGKIGNSYNIGSGEILNNLEITKLIISIMKEIKNIKTNSKVIFVKDRPGHDKRYALNSKKIYKAIKWKSKIKIKSGLKKTVVWYLNNEKWINKLNKKKFNRRMGLIK